MSGAPEWAKVEEPSFGRRLRTILVDAFKQALIITPVLLLLDWLKVLP